MDYQQSSNIVGGSESQLIIGVALFTVQNNLRGYALTVRTDGTIISAISIQDENGLARAYAPTWLGVALTYNDYFVSLHPIVSITLTAAVDSIVLHCNKPY